MNADPHYWTKQVSGDERTCILWKDWIELLWSHGALDFQKIPVIRPADGSPLIPAGRGRPIGCPETAPAGTEFVLQSFDGVQWSLHDSLQEDISPSDTVGARRSLLVEALQNVVGLSYSLFDILIGNRPPFKRHFYPWRSLPWMPPSLPWPTDDPKKTERFPVSLDDLATIFAAGVFYGRGQMKDQQSPDISDREVQGWILRDIAKAALERHGSIKPLDLLLAMGGTRVPSSNPYTWRFPNGVIMNQDDFQKAVNAVKTGAGRVKT